ncbi:Immunoglobulin I-set domain protein [Pedosphaera parvula Ellin514]|uniref:Immunoglobulin I-set domain protein n=2 Tax=Pedosphaera TaxID=1032526 RepID=B9XQT5_PEDPL|nr:Immunoglobulin I-set domain protein [Pedosphaera parvula Ellin514]
MAAGAMGEMRITHDPIMHGPLARRCIAFLSFLGFVVICGRSATAAPVIDFVYPPVINEAAGGHVAFQVSASGTGPLSYQWYQSNLPISGQTGSSLVLTNIQTTNSGEYEVTVGDSSGTYVINSVTLSVSAMAIPLYFSNLVVLRVGDGVQELSGSTGNTIYLDQYTTNGTYVSSLQIPDESEGANYGAGSSASVYGSPALLLPGVGNDCINAGLLSLSPNGQLLTFGAYCENYPFRGSDMTTAADGGPYWRGLATVDASGRYTLASTNSGLYTGANGNSNSGVNHSIRGCVTTDGTNFWTAGQAGAGGGVKCLNSQNSGYANGRGIPYVSTSSLTGTHAVQIFGTNLVYSDALAGNGAGLYICDGAPQPPANSSITARLLLNEGGQPNDFAISPDGRTIYVADGGVFANSFTRGGGIQRWDTNTISGGYTFSYTLPVDGTNGALGLAVSFPATVAQWGSNAFGAALFATDAANVLSSIIDNGPSSTATVLLNAAPYKEVLRGIRFAPGNESISQPFVSSVSVSGAQVSITVANGQPGRAFYLLSSTNLALPLAQWPIIATNFYSFDGTRTNFLIINPQESQRFYCIKQQ